MKNWDKEVIKTLTKYSANLPEDLTIHVESNVGSYNAIKVTLSRESKIDVKTKVMYHTDFMGSDSMVEVLAKAVAEMMEGW